MKFLLILTLPIILVLANPIKVTTDHRIHFRDEDVNAQYDNKNIISSRFDVDEIQSRAKKLEYGKYFQGDIILTEDQKHLIENFAKDEKSSGDGKLFRTGLNDELKRWLKVRGFVQVPYEFDAYSRYSPNEKQTIRKAMNEIEHYTCVRFVQRSNQKDFVQIHSGDGCSSYLGRVGGQQIVNLNKNGCISKGTIMHEMIHALGYDHMHCHANRDQYVEIKYNNISPDRVSNFEKVNWRLFSDFGTSYDYDSIMHYDSKAFSRNNQATIVPKNQKYTKIIGQRQTLSSGDIQRINNMYSCQIFNHL